MPDEIPPLVEGPKQVSRDFSSNDVLFDAGGEDFSSINTRGDKQRRSEEDPNRWDIVEEG